MKVSCCECKTTIVLDDSSSISDIELRGFHVYGLNEDKSLFVVCTPCTNKIWSQENTNREKPMVSQATPKKPIIPPNTLPLLSKKRIIVISNLHLGNPACERQNILAVTQQKFDKLIITGDVIDSCHYKSLSNWDAVILDALQHFQEQERLVLIRGNEEMWIKTVNLEKIAKLKFVDEYAWEYQGLNMYACNGHNLGTMSTMPRIASEYAYNRGYDVIFTGFTRIASYNRMDNGVLYVNTGGFIGPHYNWAVMDGVTDTIQLRRNAYDSHADMYGKPIKKIPMRVELPKKSEFDLPMINGKQIYAF